MTKRGDWYDTYSTGAMEVFNNTLHEYLRSIIYNKMPCQNCVKPLCSCSGSSKVHIVLLPGEREWMWSLGLPRLPGNDLRFYVDGNCPYKDTLTHGCIAGYNKPWDCLSFPLQPYWEGDLMIPDYAKNCTFHPGDMLKEWIAERWQGWMTVDHMLPSSWKELYSETPIEGI